MTDTRLTKVNVQYVADVQMYGDMDGTEWANLVLDQAKESGYIIDFQVLNSSTGLFGIEFITFLATVQAPVGLYSEMSLYGRTLLNDAMNEQDVQIRWISLAGE